MTKPSLKNKAEVYSAEDEASLEAILTYRRPRQARGLKKFEAILDSADSLIKESGVHSFSLYDIADKAGVATGSVYHFFPNIESVFVALVERYDRDFAQIVSENIPAHEVETWADIIWHHIEKSREYINTNEQVLILILGPGQTWRTKQVDTVGNSAIARAMENNLREYFDIPVSPDPTELLHYAIRILESIWQLSYQRHATVTVEMQRETYRAMCAYLELYWPRHLAIKDVHAAD